MPDKKVKKIKLFKKQPVSLEKIAKQLAKLQAEEVELERQLTLDIDRLKAEKLKKDLDSL